MTNPPDTPLRRVAVIAGGGLLVMTVAFFTADYLVFQSLVEGGDPAATVDNIKASLTQYRAGTVAYLTVLILDVAVAWAFYVFLRKAHASLSLLAAWLRLTYAAMLGIALGHLVVVSTVVRDAPAADQTASVPAAVMLHLGAFHEIWALGMIVFGLHLLVVGYVAFVSGYVPKVVAVLLLVAGLAYVIEYLVKVVLPDIELPISIVAGWGELVFAVWLLWKGGRKPDGVPDPRVSSSAIALP